MKRSRFSEEQIIGILCKSLEYYKEQETGVSVADLCRKHGDVSEATAKDAARRERAFEAAIGGRDVR
jgi:hypothetical protein